MFGLSYLSNDTVILPRILVKSLSFSLFLLTLLLRVVSYKHALPWNFSRIFSICFATIQDTYLFTLLYYKVVTVCWYPGMVFFHDHKNKLMPPLYPNCLHWLSLTILHFEVTFLKNRRITFQLLLPFNLTHSGSHKS